MAKSGEQMGGMTIRLLRGWLFVLMFVARRVDSRSLLTCRNGDEKEWTRNHKIGSERFLSSSIPLVCFFLRIKSVFIMIARDLLSFGFSSFALL
jgi:hypothetical protein